MSYAAYKTMHLPTGIWNCASGFVTHSRADSLRPQTISSPAATDPDHDPDGSPPQRPGLGPIPNLLISSGNILEVYAVRVQDDGTNKSGRGGVMDGVAGASLDLVYHCRLNGNVESLAVLSREGSARGNDSIVLAFKDAKISVLEFDDSIHGLRTSSMHCFEGPEWLHLRRGRESFARGPLVKVDPQGRCSGVLVYDLQMVILKASQAGSGFVGDDDALALGGSVAARIKSSYIISLRDVGIKHVKDFVFVHDYIEPVMVVLHEKELTWAGRVSWKHHTCMISAFSISTTSKQPTLIWSIANLPHDAYKLLSVPSPIGGVLVISTNTVHYHSESAACALALNNYAAPLDNSQELPRASFNTELDAANAAWLLNDVALLSSKTGELLLLTLVYDGRVVQRLDLSKSKASVLTSDITTIGISLFFLGSRVGDSLLVQFTCGSGSSTSSSGLKEEVGDIEGDGPSAKRLRRSPSDALQDMVGGDELLLYGSAANNTESMQKSFSFAVRDSLVNIGPLKDFAYGLRTNADVNASGIAKQSNYELVCCSGHGKNGSISVLQQSIRPEVITDVELPGCKGIWTVYNKNARATAAADDDEYHAYLIISMESRTMVLETADLLSEVTENVDYFVQGRTIAAGNLFGRRRVIQIFERGARILDGPFMTHDLKDLSLGPPNSESGPLSESFTILSSSIADPYVLLKMTDGSIRLLVGDPSKCSVTVETPSSFDSLKKSVTACTLYHDYGPEPWLSKTNSESWLSRGFNVPADGADGGSVDQGDIYCIVCYDDGDLEIFDVPNFNSVYFVDNFVSGKPLLVDTYMRELPKDPHKLSRSPQEVALGRKESPHNMKVVELAMQRWSGSQSRPFLFGILSDGTILSYHAYMFENPDPLSKVEDSNILQNSSATGTRTSWPRNLRFSRIPLDTYMKEEAPNDGPCQRISTFTNISGCQGFFLAPASPSWFMMFRERLRIHPQSGW